MVGLGNPGLDFSGNRHNVGFMAVDTITRWYSFKAFQLRFHAHVTEGFIADNKVIAMKPLTYMNNSGQAVNAAVCSFKIPLNRVIVFHDEIDLPPGKVRIKTGGSHAGHHGLRSIDAYIGDGYQRVRLGIGHPGHKNQVIQYVLHDFSLDDQLWLKPLLNALASSLPYFLSGDKDSFIASLAQYRSI